MLNPNSRLFRTSFIKSTCKWVLLIAFTLLGSLCLGAQNRFVRLPSYPAGGSLPTLLAQHDVNGDGKLDVIVMNVNATTKLETVSLLLGTGTGGYQAPKTMAYFPVSYGKPQLADVNRDGNLDLIFVVASSQSTRVFLGQGESFQSTPVVSKGGACVSGSVCGAPDIQVADFNNDGRPDLAVLPSIGSQMYVSLGNGNGSFRVPIVVNSFLPYAFTVGDFDSDGLSDVALTSGGGYQILLGDGDGSFRIGASQDLGGLPTGRILTADLRANGKTDLIVINATNLEGGPNCQYGGFAVLLGNGDGTFTVNSRNQPQIEGQYIQNAFISDMNGDKHPDLVVANQRAGSYSVFLNTGSGKFSTPFNYRSPDLSNGGFVIGDLNGDGRPDLTISAQTGVEVLRNTGGGRLLAPGSVDLPVQPIPFLTYASDLNHDGIPDLAYAGHFNAECPDQSVYEQGQGFVLVSRDGLPFSSRSTFNSPDSLYVNFGLGDFNGDGNTDIAVDGGTYLPYGLPRFGVDFNNGMGKFLTSGPTTAFDDFQYPSFSVGDFNRDGLADIAMGGPSLQIGLGDGKGNFKLAKTFPPVAYGSFLVRDINGDGKPDLLNVDNGSDSVDVLLGNGDGTLQAVKKYATVKSPSYLATGDFNRDGKLDLAVGGGSEVSLLLNNGNGTFKPAVNYPSGGPVSAIAVISLLSNGNQSVMVADSKDNKLFLLAGDGKGSLSPAVYYYPGGGNPQALTVADFNRDGASDLAVTDWTTSSYLILYNTGGTSIKLTSSNLKPIAGQTVTFTATLAASIPGTGTPGGTVTFKNGSTTLGTVTLSGGKAVFNTAALTRGTHAITALYNGSSIFNSLVSTGLTVTVQ
jgi:hypothetical protein